MSHSYAERSGVQVVDVAVIGAGPAGATAARLLAAYGHTTALIGRQARRRTLGESLPPSCTKLFDRLGIREAIDHAGFVRSTGNTVRWANTDARAEQFDAAIRGYQVARNAFDDLLIALARSHPRSSHHEATVQRVVREQHEGSRWRIEMNGLHGASTLRAAWVLDCSGRAGVIARHGWRRHDVASRTTAIVAIWERRDAWPVADNTHTIVESYERGWAWSVPVSASRRYVTIMLDPAVTDVPVQTELTRAYSAEVARTSLIRSVVDGATQHEPPWGVDASSYSSSHVFADGAVLVGDAASFIDPLSSFGVKKALASAWLAAVAVHSSLTDPVVTTDALELYADRERAYYSELQRRSAALSREVASANHSEFWAARAPLDDDGAESLDRADGGPRLEPGDDRLASAFEQLKQRDVIHLRPGPTMKIVSRAVVRGHQVRLEPHLTSARWASATRYWRNVDLVLLAELAPACDHVPDLLASYARASGVVPLPDFLSALSALVAFEFVIFED